MLFEHQIQTLLDELYELYAKIALKILHIRIQKHRKHKNTDSSPDISTHLTNHAHYLVDRHKDATTKVTWKNSTFVVKNLDRVKTLDDKNNEDYPNFINPLSDYLKNKKYVDSNHSGMADKLKLSTWNHFHSAIREARQGNRKIAIMHVDLANFAMSEMTQFMSEDECKNFHSEIEVELEKLKKLHLQKE